MRITEAGTDPPSGLEVTYLDQDSNEGDRSTFAPYIDHMEMDDQSTAG